MHRYSEYRIPNIEYPIDFYRRHGYDLINTFELRKGLDKDRRGREVEFLGRRFHLADSMGLVDG